MKKDMSHQVQPFDIPNEESSSPRSLFNLLKVFLFGMDLKIDEVGLKVMRSRSNSGNVEKEISDSQDQKLIQNWSRFEAEEAGGQNKKEEQRENFTQ
jgi:hypothetical protein